MFSCAFLKSPFCVEISVVTRFPTKAQIHLAFMSTKVKNGAKDILASVPIKRTLNTRKEAFQVVKSEFHIELKFSNSDMISIGVVTVTTISIACTYVSKTSVAFRTFSSLSSPWQLDCSAFSTCLCFPTYRNGSPPPVSAPFIYIEILTYPLTP